MIILRAFRVHDAAEGLFPDRGTTEHMKIRREDTINCVLFN